MPILLSEGASPKRRRGRRSRRLVGALLVAGPTVAAVLGAVALLVLGSWLDEHDAARAALRDAALHASCSAQTPVAVQVHQCLPGK